MGPRLGKVAAGWLWKTIGQPLQTTHDEQKLTWPYKMDRGHRFQTNRLVSAIKLANLKIYEERRRNSKLPRHGNTGGFPVLLPRAS